MRESYPCLEHGLMKWQYLTACVQMSHAQLVLPIHHASMQAKGEEACREWVNEANDYLIEHGSVSRAAYPEEYKWYNLAVGVSLSD
jgi:hypothetical protein